MKIIIYISVFIVFLLKSHASSIIANEEKWSVGNFLFDWKGDIGQTTMTLLSPHIPDEDKKERIDWYTAQGYNRIHIYFINDENYSGEKTNSHGTGGWTDVQYQAVFCGFTGVPLDDNVDMPAEWHSWQEREGAELGNYLYWLVYAKKKGLNITGWLWSNQAQDSFNNVERWPDHKVLAYNTAIVRKIGNYRWNGKNPLIDEFVVKLEGEDPGEWGMEVFNRRAEQTQEMIRTENGGQTVWYHCEGVESFDDLNWDNVDGVRIQHNMIDFQFDEIIPEAIAVIQTIPDNKLFYWSEYSDNGEKYKYIGEELSKLRGKYKGRFLGLDNGGPTTGLNEQF